MLLDSDDPQTVALVHRYLALLELPSDNLRVTTNRATFVRWLGRRIDASVGGAYVYLPRFQAHAILINLPRIDRTQPRSVEIVVAEELIHMQDYLAGDRRRHAKHGYDRIADRVVDVTGATLAEVRTCLLPRHRRPPRYIYACPRCQGQVIRRVRGTWSCGSCSPVFDSRFTLRPVADLGSAGKGEIPCPPSSPSESQD